MQAANHTVIQITANVSVNLDDENDPYYQRTILNTTIISSVEIGRVTYKHLGFATPGRGKRVIKPLGDEWSYTGMLDPNADVSVVVAPFKLYLKNVGDSFMAVHVRLPAGKNQCKISILQEQHQPKPEKIVDDFIKFEGVWYVTATINCLQTLRIEELKGE